MFCSPEAVSFAFIREFTNVRRRRPRMPEVAEGKAKGAICYQKGIFFKKGQKQK